MSRGGAPTKIKREILEQARQWCKGRAFTPIELQSELERMSGVRLSISQEDAKRWGYSRKKDCTYPG